MSISELRKFRIMEYAVFDFVASFLFIYLLKDKINKLLNISWSLNRHFYAIIPFAVLVHHLFSIETKLNSQLKNPLQNPIQTMIVIGLTYLTLTTK